VLWPIIGVRLLDGERPELLHTCHSPVHRERQLLAEPRSTEPIMCACPSVRRTSVVAPNTDVGTDYKYEFSKRRETTQRRHTGFWFKLPERTETGHSRAWFWTETTDSFKTFTSLNSIVQVGGFTRRGISEYLLRCICQ
jgi:hypothetical protein